MKNTLFVLLILFIALTIGNSQIKTTVIPITTIADKSLGRTVIVYFNKYNLIRLGESNDTTVSVQIKLIEQGFKLDEMTSAITINRDQVEEAIEGLKRIALNYQYSTEEKDIDFYLEISPLLTFLMIQKDSKFVSSLITKESVIERRFIFNENLVDKLKKALMESLIAFN